MRVLVVGGAGQVARALMGSVPPQMMVTAMTHAQLNILDPGAVANALESSGANWLVNAAAYTAVDLAEDEPDEARAINQTAVGVLAHAATRVKCRLLHFSTDFVFDGKSNRAYLPGDGTNPINAYGASKLGGEAQALATGMGVVLRTSWVYAAQGRNFVLTMLRLMREQSEVRVVCDQIGAPTWATGIAHAVWDLIAINAAPGIYHWTDLGVASWYDFAVAIQEEAIVRGLVARAVPIVPIQSSAYVTKARRPAFSVLDTESTRKLVATQAVHWRSNLRMMMDELRAE